MIVISYSLRHFNPLRPDFVWGSAGQIARDIYEATKDIVGPENVLMVDALDTSSWGKVRAKVEVLITIESNAIAAKRYFRPERTLYISVNHHPKSRKSLLKRALRSGIPIAALDASDGFFEVGEGAQAADKILQIGDIRSIRSYLNEGIKFRDIFPVSYRPDHHEWQGYSNQKDILCHLGSLGYRKGMDLVLELANHLHISQSDRKIHVTGSPVNAYWNERFRAAEESMPENIEFHGWIEPSQVEFQDLLNSCQLAIFPTREEGLSGAYLEVALSGIPVITTEFVGIETSSELTMRELSKESLVSIFEKSLLDYSLILESAQFTKKMYSSIDASKNQIKEAITRFVNTNRIWPEINIIVPIHNKSKTIKKLLAYVSSAANNCDNANLTLINDGSSDNTQELLNAFVKSTNKNIFNEVKLLESPDIFEVKSNNLGIQQFESDFHIIVQDDNLIYDSTLLIEMISLASKYENIGAIGGLAGVNFFPIVENCELHKPGQHSVSGYEHYWRQDAETDPSLVEKYFQVDAVMRGPLLMSSNAIDKIGTFDERYAPLYCDDMAWCFKARKYGFEVLALLGGVMNNSETMGNPTESQNIIYKNAFEKNTKLFYKDWTPVNEKHYSQFLRGKWEHEQNLIFRVKSHFRLPAIINKKTMRTYILINYPTIANYASFSIGTLRKLRKILLKHNF